jgi:hypothetical protein
LLLTNETKAKQSCAEEIEGKNTTGRNPGWLPLPQPAAYRKAAPNKRDYIELRLQWPNHVYLKNPRPLHLQHLKRSATSFPTGCRLAPICSIIILHGLAETQSVHGLKPIEILPIELFVRILDYLKPHEYLGLSCTCQHAVTLVNRKLDNLKDQEELWVGFDLDETRALNKQLPSWKNLTLTARYVAKERKKRRRERREERKNYQSSSSN